MELIHKLLLDLRTALIDTRRGRLLFEYELAFAMSPDETFELMNGMMRMFPGMRIAFVTSDPRHQMSLDSGIDVSIAAGQEHQSFTDPAAAQEWLLQPSAD